MYNDEWISAKRFIENSGMTAGDLAAMGVSGELFAVEAAPPLEPRSSGAELDRSIRRVEDAIAPYVQFVEGNRASRGERRRKLVSLRERLTALRSSVETA